MVLTDSDLSYTRTYYTSYDDRFAVSANTIRLVFVCTYVYVCLYIHICVYLSVHMYVYLSYPVIFESPTSDPIRYAAYKDTIIDRGEGWYVCV